MIPRSTKKIVGNETRAHQLWKVVASGFSPNSRRNRHQQRHFISSSFHSGREDAVREFHIIESTVPDVHLTSHRLDDVAHFHSGKDRITEQFGITGRRDHRWWTGSKRSSPGAGYQGPECSSSGWSSKLGRSPDRSGSLLELWSRGGTIRVLFTKPEEGDDSIHTSSEEKPQTKEDAPARPKTIDDFQHEEIVGPTVERDKSVTANELRASLGQLTTFMTSLRTGFVILGSVQLLAALWSSYFHGVGLILGLSQDLAFAMSFLLAYLLRIFGSRVEFFSKIEDRSRMRILTLSLQAIKMLAMFFFRSSFVVKATALCSLLALLGDVWHSLLNIV